MIDDSGEIKSIYRKIHLFDVAIPEKNIFLRESDFNIGGSQIVQPVETPAGMVGLSIVSLTINVFHIIYRKVFYVFIILFRMMYEICKYRIGFQFASLHLFVKKS